MTARRRNQDRKNYYKKLNRAKQNSLYCSDCFTFLPPSQLAQHIYNCHGVDKNHTCPWCREGFPTKYILNNVPHLDACFQTYRKTHKVLKTQKPRASSTSIDMCFEFSAPPSPHMSESVPPILFESCNDRYDECKQLLDRFRTRGVYHVSDQNLHFTPESGLGNDTTAYIRDYLEFGRHAKWYHLVVNASAYQSFADEMANVTGVAILPYWCLCDASSNEEKSLVQRVHKHMMAISLDPNVFSAAWKCVKPSEYQMRSRCKKGFLIKNAMHFMNVINYVCGEKCSSTSCFGDKDPALAPPKAKRKSGRHFYRNRSLFRHAQFAMCVSFIGGLQLFLNEKCKSKSIGKWKTLVKTGKQQQWIAEIGEVYPEYKNCVLPLVGIPDSKQTSGNVAYMYFTGTNKLAVVPSSASRNRNLQRDAGNCFLDRIVCEPYVLSPSQQKIANNIAMAKNQVRLEIQTEMTSQKNNFETELQTLRLKNATLQSENDALKRQSESELQTVLKKNKTLRQRLRKTNAKWSGQVERLNAEITRLNEQVISGLTRELEFVKTELERTKIQFANDMAFVKKELERERREKEHLKGILSDIAKDCPELRDRILFGVPNAKTPRDATHAENMDQPE